MRGLIYNTTTGAIRAVAGGQGLFDQPNDGEAVYAEVITDEDDNRIVRDFAGLDRADATHRMNLSTGKPEPKPELPVSIDKTTAATGEDITLSGLPTSGGEVWGKVKGGGGHRIEPFSDGELVLSFDTPGTYTIILRHPLYLERQGEVTIT